MREVVHLTADDVREFPWRNGRGVTEELALWPPGSAFERGDFDWRISKASVAEPGPFSAFPGFDRILVVTEGDGLVLEHGDRARRARLRRFEPYGFSGDWPTTAELASGPVADFNVLVRRGSFRADIEVSKLARRRVRETIGPGHVFVHALSGSGVARVTGEEEPFELGARESLWARGLLEGDELDFAGQADDSVILLVRIDAVPGADLSSRS
jgi:environmental stress-induced protein Ves